MKKQLLLLTLGFWLALGSGAQAAMRVDIYGPGQNIVNLALAAPLKGPQAEASGMGSDLQKIVQQNLSFLPFMRLTDPKAVLGGRSTGRLRTAVPRLQALSACRVGHCGDNLLARRRQRNPPRADPRL